MYPENTTKYRLTKREAAVLMILCGAGGALTPAQVAQRLEKMNTDGVRAGARDISRPLKKLCTLGLVIRVAINKRVVSYAMLSHLMPLFEIVKKGRVPKDFHTPKAGAVRGLDIPVDPHAEEPVVEPEAAPMTDPPEVMGDNVIVFPRLPKG